MAKRNKNKEYNNSYLLKQINCNRYQVKFYKRQKMLILKSKLWELLKKEKHLLRWSKKINLSRRLNRLSRNLCPLKVWNLKKEILTGISHWNRNKKTQILLTLSMKKTNQVNFRLSMNKLYIQLKAFLFQEEA